MQLSLLATISLSALTFCLAAAAAEVDIAGKIADENGQPVAFAKVELRFSPSATARRGAGRQWPRACEWRRHRPNQFHPGWIQYLRPGDRPLRRASQYRIGALSGPGQRPLLRR